MASRLRFDDEFTLSSAPRERFVTSTAYSSPSRESDRKRASVVYSYDKTRRRIEQKPGSSDPEALIQSILANINPVDAYLELASTLPDNTATVTLRAGNTWTRQALLVEAIRIAPTNASAFVALALTLEDDSAKISIGTGAPMDRQMLLQKAVIITDRLHPEALLHLGVALSPDAKIELPIAGQPRVMTKRDIMTLLVENDMNFAPAVFELARLLADSRDLLKLRPHHLLNKFQLLHHTFELISNSTKGDFLAEIHEVMLGEPGGISTHFVGFPSKTKPKSSSIRLRDLCKATIAVDANSASAYYYLAISVGTLQSGRSAWAKALDLAPNNTTAYFLCGRYLIRRGIPNILTGGKDYSAWDVMAKGLAQNADRFAQAALDLHFLNRPGLTLVDGTTMTSKLLALEALRLTDSKHSLALVALAFILAEAGLSSVTMPSLEVLNHNQLLHRALELDSNNAFALTSLGLTLASLEDKVTVGGQVATAKDLHFKALHLEPFHPLPYINLAVMLQKHQLPFLDLPSGHRRDMGQLLFKALLLNPSVTITELVGKVQAGQLALEKVKPFKTYFKGSKHEAIEEFTSASFLSACQILVDAIVNGKPAAMSNYPKQHWKLFQYCLATDWHIRDLPKGDSTDWSFDEERTFPKLISWMYRDPMEKPGENKLELRVEETFGIKMETNYRHWLHQAYRRAASAMLSDPNIPNTRFRLFCEDATKSILDQLGSSPFIRRVSMCSMEGKVTLPLDFMKRVCGCLGFNINLRELCFDGCQFGFDELKHVCTQFLPNSPHARVVIKGNPMLTGMPPKAAKDWNSRLEIPTKTPITFDKFKNLTDAKLAAVTPTTEVRREFCLVNLTDNSFETGSGLVHLFPNITVLDLSGNALTTLSGLLTLKYLVALTASKNKLTDLPNDIYRWKYMERLDVSSNRIQVIDSLATLASLRSLDVHDNKIVSLPASLVDSGLLFEIVVHDNPLQPEKLRITGSKDIIKYLKLMQTEGKVKWNQMKIVLCGEEGNLHHVLESKPLDWPTKISLLLDIAKGVSHLHSLKPPVIHRDLRSPNILITEKRTQNGLQLVAKVADFGLSLQTPNAKENLRTWRWHAPEAIQYRTSGYNELADSYSFGQIIWHCAHPNSWPFDGYDEYLHVEKKKLTVADLKSKPEALAEFKAQGWKATTCPDNSVLLVRRTDEVNVSSIIKAIVEHNLRPKITTEMPEFLHQLMLDCWKGNPAKRPSFATIVQTIEKHHTDLALTSPAGSVSGAAMSSSQAIPSDKATAAINASFFAAATLSFPAFLQAWNSFQETMNLPEMTGDDLLFAFAELDPTQSGTITYSQFKSWSTRKCAN